ncbi:MAG: aldehyde dehydrogenase [bacterium]
MHEKLTHLIQTQKDFFNEGITKNIDFRINILRTLKKIIENNEDRIIAAIQKDLGRNEVETYLSEIAPVISEIKYTLKHLKKWARPKKVPSPFILLPAKSYHYAESYGTVLIISPWNYPFQLVFSPLIGAIAAGNCAVIKPSELSPYTSQVITDLITTNFEPSYIAAVEGGVEETTELLAQKFDYIFFTGGTNVGRIIMEAAAKHLTPLTLELGGKSPCIVHEDADIKTSARRITWGKYFNAGQTCTAPDYLLVHKKIKKELLEQIKKTIETFYGTNPQTSNDYGRIINERHFDRLSSLLDEGKCIIGGKTDREKKYISPTVIDSVSWNDKIMADEIFGPIFPVIEYEDLDEVIRTLKNHPKPLALYFFSKDNAQQKKIVRELSAGGISINDTMAHIQNIALKFGGVGQSGMGAYHGRSSFDTFTHYKAVCKRYCIAEPKAKYPPYTMPIRYVKKIMKWIQ